MIKHIVMWTLKTNAHGNDKETNARLIKEKLESLNGRIPGMIKIEVGISCGATDSSSDIVLYSELESQNALDAYQDHPEHKSMKLFIFEARSERREVDYQI